MRTLAILHAAQFVTLAGPRRPRVGAELGELAIVRDGGMLVRDGIVVATGSSDEIERIAPNETSIVDANGRVVLPGFVDAHAHPVFGGDRLDEFEMRTRGASYEEIAARGGGIRSTVRKTRVATEEQLQQRALKHARWFLQCGTTTVEAKSGYGLSLADELKILRVIRDLKEETPLELVPTFLGAHAVPDEYQDAPERYVDLVANEMLPQVAAERLAEYCDVFCEPGYFDLEMSGRLLTAAKAFGLGLRMHADQLTNSGGANLAAELSATTADHLEQTEDDGIAALKKGGVQPVLLPGSVYSLGKTRYPRAREMIRAGLAVVLATDFNPGSSPTPSMPMVLSLACTQMKMTPAEGVTAATINAAYSLARGQKIGSLEPGKVANFVVLDCADYRELAYYFGAPQISSVYIRGQRVWQAM
ncbi:MAG: imidazolonepropionase [Chthoniobacterales bacterium]|nr:imidazolonepropionase [Chthoniobacterales bacterium]MBA3762757.1 imidazolonepropionase [Chthoniobacterales bacterium]